MMTLDLVLAQAYLKELDALSRVRRAIVAHSADDAWVYCLAAIDARLAALRDLLAREDPQVIRTCQAMLVETPGGVWLTPPGDRAVHRIH